MNYIEIGYWSLIFGTTYVYRYDLLKWCNYNFIRLKDKWEIYNRKETIQDIKNRHTCIKMPFEAFFKSIKN